MHYLDSLLKKQKLPLHRKRNDELYIFPISDLNMKTESFSIGFVEFVSKEVILEKYPNINLHFFKNNCFAIVDCSRFNLQERNNGKNSLALKYLKEVIGYIYFNYYFKIDRVGDIKILISNKPDTNLDEGLVPYFSVKEDKANIVYSGSADFSVNSDLIKTFDLNFKAFEKGFNERSELEGKIFKCFEYLYYIKNEIYATERMTKYFILLNHVFRKNDSEDLNRKGLAMYLNFIFNSIKINPFKEQNYLKFINYKEKKFSAEFEDLYDLLRNNYLHGMLDLYRETTLVDIHYFYPIRILFMELLKYLLNTIDTNSINSSEKLIEVLDKSIKNLRKEKMNKSQ